MPIILSSRFRVRFHIEFLRIFWIGIFTLASLMAGMDFAGLLSHLCMRLILDFDGGCVVLFLNS